MKWFDKGRIITVFNKYFNAFLDDERAISGNKIYSFTGRIRRIFLKELLGEPLSKRDTNYKEEYGVKT